VVLSFADRATNLPDIARILVVDDESGIVQAVRREISGHGQDGRNYQVETFTNPLEALEYARTHEFHAVLADYRMPEMDGIAFLKALQTLQPDCARLVLSGQTDMSALVRMINETHIFRFIAKPWSRKLLKASLAQALDFRTASLQHRKHVGTADRPDEIAGSAEKILVLDEDRLSAKNVAQCLARHSSLDDLYAEMVMEFHVAHTNRVLGEIDVLIPESPIHALEFADSSRIACLVAECRFDGMDNREFFLRFAEKQPDCTIILLSAEPNIREIAFATPQLFTFLIKPWNEFELRVAVAQALAHRHIALESRAFSPS
jgi:DNA-binding NtrC family response regulator